MDSSDAESSDVDFHAAILSEGLAQDGVTMLAFIVRHMSTQYRQLFRGHILPLHRVRSGVARERSEVTKGADTRLEEICAAARVNEMCKPSERDRPLTNRKGKPTEERVVVTENGVICAGDAWVLKPQVRPVILNGLKLSRKTGTHERS